MRSGFGASTPLSATSLEFFSNLLGSLGKTSTDLQSYRHVHSSLVNSILEIAVSLLPVLTFLAALVFLDSYKLVKLRSMVITILCGVVAAVCALVLNGWMISTPIINLSLYVRYVAPIVEETAKAMYLMYLVRSRRIGFMVDAAIYGFAIGTGFALTENVYYLNSISDTNLLVWLMRGLGTAIMHGGTTAIFAVMGKSLSDVKGKEGMHFFLPGLVVAVVIHSMFNHFFFSPLLSTIGVLIVLPSIMLIVFYQSEKATRTWLGVGFDTDVELLEIIKKGDISATRIGMYLHTLQDKFTPEVVVDLLCYLRIYLELAIQAKGILLMRESGFDVPPDPAVQEQFKELQYLQHSIGKTGLLALAPFIHTSNRDLWQLHTLQG
jgi:RsiW-degrading membrane proteinase PrsW (M82 family)